MLWFLLWQADDSGLLTIQIWWVWAEIIGGFEGYDDEDDDEDDADADDRHKQQPDWLFCIIL